LCAEDGDRKFVWNIGTFPQIFTESHPRRQFCVLGNRRQFCVLWNISSCKWLSWVHQSVWCFEWVAACEGVEGCTGSASSSVVQTCEPCRGSCSCASQSWAGELCNLIFLQLLVSGLQSFGMWHCVLWQMGSNALEEPAAWFSRVG
jgi:hypothetical protein